VAEHRVAVLGAAGYGGALCAAIVNAHPSLELTTITARSDAGKRHDDLYHGEQVGEGSKSLALRLEFRAPDRTLTDEEVAERRGAITEALGGIGGSLRE